MCARIYRALHSPLQLQRESLKHLKGGWRGGWEQKPFPRGLVPRAGQVGQRAATSVGPRNPGVSERHGPNIQRESGVLGVFQGLVLGDIQHPGAQLSHYESQRKSHPNRWILWRCTIREAQNGLGWKCPQNPPVPAPCPILPLDQGTQRMLNKPWENSITQPIMLHLAFYPLFSMFLHFLPSPLPASPPSECSGNTWFGRFVNY